MQYRKLDRKFDGENFLSELTVKIVEQRSLGNILLHCNLRFD